MPRKLTKFAYQLRIRIIYNIAVFVISLLLTGYSKGGQKTEKVDRKSGQKICNAIVNIIAVDIRNSLQIRGKATIRTRFKKFHQKIKISW